MSQRDALRALDATIDRALKAAGLVDAAFYVPPGAPPIAAMPCEVLVDRDVEVYGDEGTEVAARITTVTFQRLHVEPRRGGTVVIGQAPGHPAAERLKLGAPVEQDESRAVWSAIDA